MKTTWLLALGALLLTSALVEASSGELSVKSSAGNKATLGGDTTNLKAGDFVYAARSPFRFTVSEIKGADVVINVPAGIELNPGLGFVRAPNEAIKKNMLTEQKLKHALED